MGNNGSENGQSSSDNREVDLRPELDEALLALDELTLDDPEEALSMFDSLPEGVQALPEFQLLLARAHQALGQLEAARDLLNALIAGPNPAPDAHHLLGDVLEDLGDGEAANEHFLRTRELDLAAFLQEEDRSTFTATLTNQLAILAGELPWDGLSTALVDIPTEEQVRDGLDPRAHADFDESSGCLTAFTANLFAECGDLEEPDELNGEIRLAIIREVADAFELTDEQLGQLGVLDDPTSDEN